MKAIISYCHKEKALDRVISVLKKESIEYSAKQRDTISAKDFKNTDLVITVGGDGTFLRTSHHVKDTLMIGVNPDKKKNEGVLLSCDMKNLSKKLKKHKIARLTRLEVLINKKKIPILALNDIYFGHQKPYITSRYKIMGEEQKSSGVVVSTPAGSTAWHSSAGGKRLPLEAEKFQFIVRDPYSGRLSRVKKLKRTLSKKQTLKITAIYDSIIVIDSTSKEFKVRKGDTVEIRVSPTRLSVAR